MTVKEVYTIAEVAELLRFSEVTIRVWVREGKIRAIRPGSRAWRIPRVEVERLMSEYGIRENQPGGATIEDESHRPDLVAA